MLIERKEIMNRTKIILQKCKIMQTFQQCFKIGDDSLEKFMFQMECVNVSHKNVNFTDNFVIPANSKFFVGKDIDEHRQRINTQEKTTKN